MTIADPGPSPDLLPDRPAAPAAGARPTAPALAPGAAIEPMMALVGGFPGPAILLDLEEGIQAASEHALWLLADLADAAWWHGLVGWLLAGDPPSPPQHSTTIESPQATMIVEWQAVRIAGRWVVLLGRDVTAERNLRGALADSRQRFRDLVELAADFAWETDAEGRFVYVSPPGALGFPAADLVGTRAEDLLALDGQMVASPFVADRPVAETELWLRRADAGVASVVAWAQPIVDDGDRRVGVRGLCRDVTDDRQRDLALSRARNRERASAHIVHAMTGHREPIDGVKAALDALKNAVGGCGAALKPRERLDGSPDLDLVTATAEQPICAVADRLFADNLDARVRAAAPAPVMVDADGLAVLAVAICYAQSPTGTLAVWRQTGRGPWEEEDIDLVALLADQFGIALTNTALFERLRYQAERDALTGLYNRRAMLALLGTRLHDCSGVASALLYIDLDNFKVVNDVVGHHQGDQVLGALSALLRGVVAPNDLAGRLGGDEFVLWLAGRDGEAATAIAQSLIDGMRDIARTLSGAPDRPLGLSIGIALVAPGRPAAVGDVIARSDAAMYRAKQKGKATGTGGLWMLDDGGATP